MRLASQNSPGWLEVLAPAMAIGSPRYCSVASILKTGLD